MKIHVALLMTLTVVVSGKRKEKGRRDDDISLDLGSLGSLPLIPCRGCSHHNTLYG